MNPYIPTRTRNPRLVRIRLAGLTVGALAGAAFGWPAVAVLAALVIADAIATAPPLDEHVDAREVTR